MAQTDEQPRIILVEDEVPDEEFYTPQLRKEFPGYTWKSVATMEDAILAIRDTGTKSPLRLVIADLFLYKKDLGDAPALLRDQLFRDFFLVRTPNQRAEDDDPSCFVIDEETRQGKLGSTFPPYDKERDPTFRVCHLHEEYDAHVRSSSISSIPQSGKGGGISGPLAKRYCSP